MLFGGKPLDEINEDDLLGLIGKDENDIVDFKTTAYSPPPESELPDDQSKRKQIRNKWKVELCTDISAFANASGGWIICGMKEEGGEATELCGLGAIDAEQECNRLEQVAMSGIEPPIPMPGFRCQPINLQDSTKSKAIVIRIPRSYRAPHRVKETSKFHVRRSRRNDPMTIDELRVAFNLSEHLVERIKNFRRQRVEAIGSKEHHEDIPVILTEGIRVILHVIPLSFSEPGSSVELSMLQYAMPGSWSNQLSMYEGRFNLDGYVHPIGSVNFSSPSEGYIQVFRNGIVECVEVYPERKISLEDQTERKYVPLIELEDIYLDHLNTALTIQKHLEVNLPSAVMLSILGGRDCHLIPSSNYDFEIRRFIKESPATISRNTILIPDKLVEDYDQNQKLLIKPLFDMLWNVGGFERSKSYDENGNWIREK